MEHEKIIAAAEQYLQLEQNSYFADQVQRLLADNDQDELRERFYRPLEFGTGGMRGIIGGGLNRMNNYVVERATQGLANYIKKSSGSDKLESVVIAYDSRHFSREFSQSAAMVFAGNGIKCYLFSTIHPTPLLSFAVRHLQATAGIVVTASHNPPEYNGYKVYWRDGGQIVPPHDKLIVAGIEQLNGEVTRYSDRTAAIEAGLLEEIGAQVDNAYLQMVKDYLKRRQLTKEHGKNLLVVYTPLHGVGGDLVLKLLNDMGITPIPVADQMAADGDFPTVKSPNPEEAAALRLAIELAKENRADIVLATDPDADRLGIAVNDGNGDYVLLSGNQLGALLADYILTGYRQRGELKEGDAMIKTIVTSELQRDIADSFGINCYDVLTGFKYIGQMIEQFQARGNTERYLFGGEESYGYLVTDKVRDKDAVSAAAVTCEMALYYKQNGGSLLERLRELHEQHGYYQETLISKNFSGEAGIKRIAKLMDKLRRQPPVTIAGETVTRIADYRQQIMFNLTDGSRNNLQLPESNVLQYTLQSGAKVTVRPSGTEPKIKFYASLKSNKKPLSVAKKSCAELMREVEKEIKRLLE